VPHPDEGAGSDGFRHLGDTVRHRGWRIALVEASFESPEGTPFTRDVVRHPGAVAVVPVTAQGTVLLVRQYRGSLDTELLEIPAGTRDVEDEPPEITAGRELEEEVGVRARDIRRLVATANTPGFSDQISILYLATGLEPVPTGRHGEEERHMEVVEIPLAEAIAMIGSGEIVDAETIIGLLLARDALAAPGP
jgi:8-oxo-dGTP pyrophosphatase MutT (NUDIX family)